MREDHAPDAERVCGRLARLVEERAGDVAHAVAEEEHGVRHDFLGVPGRVGRLQGEEQDEGGVDWAREL